MLAAVSVLTLSSSATKFSTSGWGLVKVFAASLNLSCLVMLLSSAAMVDEIYERNSGGSDSGALFGLAVPSF